jgi:hypothetical protein
MLPELGPYPSQDGWSWAYRLYERCIKPLSPLRAAVRLYFLPRPIELWRQSLAYRLLGVQHFGRIVPTGGVWVRRLTHAPMRAYTLAGASPRAARRFFFRACIFEALHLPFMLAMVGLALQRYSIGRVDLALENLLINLAVSVYPILHHRHTRARIVNLLVRSTRP